MTNQKSTKKALLSSVLSLVLCLTMLIGTTFAWFTDSVTSTGNIIKSGTLDVTMEWLDGKTNPTTAADNEWKDASTGAIFNSTLWEPGYTEVRHIKIANEGTLALKYKLNIIANGEVSELADVIDVYYIDPAVQVTDRTALTADKKIGTLSTILANLAGDNSTATGNLLAGEKDTITLALKMQESAGNKYQDLAIGSDFTIQLIATQLTAENDSFDNQYDADASLDFTPVSNIDELKMALAAKMDNIVLTRDCYADAPLIVDYAANIDGNGFVITRADDYTGTVFAVASGASLTLENVVVDGGAVWTGDVDSVLQRGVTNSGMVATGNLIATEGDGNVVLNSDAILQNNVGAHAVSLATRGGGSLTLNGGQIINNQSDSGAIWGGGAIIVNEGSKINGNSSTGSAGAIRMVGNCDLTINGGEINHNKAAGDGGAIWGYGTTHYTFNGGEMAYNEAVGTGGAIYTGNYSMINISGDFELHDNKASNSGAIRLTDHTSMTMTGGKVYGNTQNGESNAFNTWNNSISITGGEISDNFSYSSGLDLTIGAADIDGIISYDLFTNHNTAYLKKDFTTFKFTVNEDDEHFGNFNFKPEDGYTYTEGDEAKLICMNDGYSTYWDAETGTFRLKAKNI